MSSLGGKNNKSNVGGTSLGGGGTSLGGNPKKEDRPLVVIQKKVEEAEAEDRRSVEAQVSAEITRV